MAFVNGIQVNSKSMNGILSVNANDITTDVLEFENGDILNSSTIAAQSQAIAANTAKVGITATQATAITNNTAKVGITTEQATAIGNNTTAISVIDTSLGIVDASINSITQSISMIDTSLGIVDTSINSITQSISVIDNSLGIVDTSINSITQSISVIDNSLSIVDASINSITQSISVIDNSLGIVDASINSITQSITGTALLAGGTEASPQTFTEFNKFSNTTEFKDIELKSALANVNLNLNMTSASSNTIFCYSSYTNTQFGGTTNSFYQLGGIANLITQGTAPLGNRILQNGGNSQFRTDGFIQIAYQLYINNYGIYYNGSNGTGTANGIAFKWTSPYMYGRVDNVVDMVVGNASDRRLKKNIKSIPNETSRKFLDVIKPRSYNSAECDVSGIKISCDCDELMYGGVAQEIEEHFPELVHSPEDDGIKSLRTESIVFMTISSLQLIDKNVKELQERISKLEAAQN